jgi:DNA-binding transcriptional MerR regulator
MEISDPIHILPMKELVDHDIQKRYFSIKDVANILAEKPFTIRKWSREFPGFSPKKRFHHSFNQSELQTLLTIKSLLREKMFRIEGAKKVLKEKLKNINGD